MTSYPTDSCGEREILLFFPLWAFYCLSFFSASLFTKQRSPARDIENGQENGKLIKSHVHTVSTNFHVQLAIPRTLNAHQLPLKAQNKHQMNPKRPNFETEPLVRSWQEPARNIVHRKRVTRRGRWDLNAWRVHMWRVTLSLDGV